MGRFVQDIRYAIRTLARSPGFTAAAVLSLALGIGVNSGMFTVVNAALFRPIPGVQAPERLVSVYQTSAGARGFMSTLSYPDFADLHRYAGALAGIAAHAPRPVVVTGADGGSERLLGEVVSGNYFGVLGVPAFRGRTFLAEEDEIGAPVPVVVLSHGFWKRSFGADPAVLGKTVALNGVPFTVVGIAPENFRGYRLEYVPELWVPLAAYGAIERGDPLRFTQRDTRWLGSVARLKPDMNTAQARASLDALGARLAEQHPATNRGRSFDLVAEAAARTSPRSRGASVSFFTVLMGVVGLVLLIACANVANLLLARASTRRNEICVRAAVGACRGQLIRQLLTESMVLALSGGAVGLLAADWTGRLIAAFRLPGVAPGTLDLAVDFRVLGFTLALALATGVVFGLAPAFEAARAAVAPVLRDASAGAGHGRRGAALRNGLAAAQVAVSLVLLVSAGLLLQGVRKAYVMDPGFHVSDVLLMTVDLGRQGYPEARARLFYHQLGSRLAAVPGIQAASVAADAPLETSETTVAVDAGKFQVKYNAVDPQYFRTLGIRLLRGRGFSPEDRQGAPGVAVVSQAAASRLWPGADPLGKRIRLGGAQNPHLEVVGVAADTNPFAAGPLVQAYLPLAQSSVRQVTLHVRASEPAAVVPAVRGEIRALDPGLPVFGVQSMRDHLGMLAARQRTAAWLTAAFGALALLLAGLGIYGVVSYSVARRTHEIGVRMALGAGRTDVLRSVLRQGALLAAAGIAVGLAAALPLSRFLEAFGTAGTADPAIFVAAALFMVAVVLAATYIPARRASAVDPMAALRCD